MKRPLIAALAALLLPAAVHAEEPCPRFEVTGTGPDLVLVPGLGSHPETWSIVKESLAKDYRLHLVHVAGFAGRPPQGDPARVLQNTEAEIIRHLDCQKIERAAYAGHSLGGFLGLMLGADHPDRITRVVVVDSLPFFPLIFNPGATVASSRRIAEDTRFGLLAQDRDSFAEGQRRGVLSLVKTPAWQGRVADWSIASDRASFAAAIHALMTTDMRPRLNEVKVPVRVIAAANPYAPRARVEPLFRSAYAGTPDFQLTVIDDSYHFVMFDQPEAFEAALRAGLAETAAPAPAPAP
ncbi:alpha/beta fold hydrolase [Erythrobacter donghaensis]|jgi:pimeloyl-ACP methyl ester carboxylesterase|uniref:alpha/beta fold hydrolase n=1 Tax=Erythrobacter donghaensis TaxID=267135 RepID=UPI00093A5E12|nr:alpha/beta hydrolase [Erythrobacter donghaensis]